MWSRICLVSVLIVLFCGKSFSKKRVCVIGAGMAGLAAVKQLSEYVDEIEPIVFEKNSNVGGLWIYTDSQGLDENGLPTHSRVYKNMKTTFDKETMTYPDYRPFKGSVCHSHVSHDLILEYMRNYTEHFNLRQYIEFNTLVEKVEPVGKNGKWWIQTQNLKADKRKATLKRHRTMHLCDYVMVCNGHHYTPKIPNIRGIETFTGRVIHSSVYRKPEDFAGQTVIVLGGSTSGIDISNDLSPYVKTVYLSHRYYRITDDMPENVVQIRGVVAANGSKLVLQDNSTIDADALIYCTGYLYTYPFLDEKSGIAVDDNFLYPLYKIIVNVEHPSMAFIGLQVKIVYGAASYVQSKYFTALIRGKVTLTNKTQMLKDAELFRTARKRKTHDLEESIFKYYTELARQGGFDDLPEFYSRSVIAEVNNMHQHPVHYKDYDLIRLKNKKIVFVLETSTCSKINAARFFVFFLTTHMFILVFLLKYN